VERLKQLASCEEMFLKGPVGYYATGEHLLMWCTRPELCGLVLWGRPSGNDVQQLANVFDHGEHTTIATPCDFVLDARRIDGVGAGIFEELVRDANVRIREIRRRVRRQAFVRPSGLLGAAVAGFYAVMGVDFARTFTELEPALSWLGDPQAGPLGSYLEDLVAETVSGSALIDRLRAWLLSESGASVSVEQAGRAVGVSTRSLQRRLSEAGTSFRSEVDHARLVRAKQLLIETEDKIAEIAHRVGCSSEANFISLFGRLEGMSPGEWRRQNRPTP
jgi:AraC-like DNA-binding protein